MPPETKPEPAAPKANRPSLNDLLLAEPRIELDITPRGQLRHRPPRNFLEEAD